MNKNYHKTETPSCCSAPASNAPLWRRYLEAMLAIAAVLALYYGARALGFAPDGFGVTENMTLGAALVMGLVAATSTCVATSGGLLLGISSRYAEQHPELRGFDKFKPHLYFNLGRLASYGFLGGAVGAAGTAFALSPWSSGLIILIASAAMIILGFQLLKVFSSLARFMPRLPRFLSMDNAASPKGAFLAGASTFFLPCGFTQALQLYVLSVGGVFLGASTMFVFALGTLPALLSVGALASVIKGQTQQYFLKFAGAAVLLIGFMNVRSGLTLMGLNPGLALVVPVTTAGAEAPIAKEGKQTVRMKIVGLQYEPANFTVKKGVPVEWLIDSSGARGCSRVLTAPKLGLTTFLKPQGIKKITFTPQESGFIAFSCSMGMTTPGAGFRVVD